MHSWCLHHMVPRVLCRILLVWKALPKWAATSECHQPFIHCDIRAWVIEQLKLLYPLIPHCSKSCQLVSLPSGSPCLSIIKSDYSGKNMKSLQRHCGMKYIALPVSASHRLAVDLSFDLQTPARMRTPKYACKCILSSSFYFSPNTHIPSRLVILRMIIFKSLIFKYEFQSLQCCELFTVLLLLIL